MTITTRTLVEDARLQLNVAVDAGLEAEVRWVLTTELSDPTRYLHGGEVVLTNGLWLEMGTEPGVFVERVKRMPISAVGFGLGEDGAMPAELIEACRAAGLTLLAVPYHVAFADICEAFAGYVQTAQHRAMQLAIDLSGEYVDASAGKQSVLGILDVLSRARSVPVHLLGPGPTIRSNARDRISPDEATRLWRLVRDHASRGIMELEGWVVFPILLTDRPPAFLLVAGPRAAMSAETRLSVEQALIFLVRELRYEYNLLETEQRFTNELVGLALAGPGQDEAVRVRLHALQLDPDRPLCVIAARETDPTADLTLISQYLRGSQGLECIVARPNEDTLVITQWPNGASAPALAERIIRDLGGGFVLGIGVTVPSSTNLRSSLVTSRQAVEFAFARPTPAGFACHTDLASYDILIALQDQDLVRSFCDGVLGALETYDRVHNSDLIATLECFLRADCRWQSTADELFIHVNTLRHRVSRMEKLTGRDLASMQDRVDFAVALAARSARRPPA